MIRQGQAKRFSTESGNDEKLNSVDVSCSHLFMSAANGR